MLMIVTSTIVKNMSQNMEHLHQALLHIEGLTRA